jgi:hypothetical protein
MQRFPTELLIYALLFAAIVLFNYVAQRIARRQKERAHAQQRARAEEERRSRPRAAEEEFFGRTRKPKPMPVPAWEPAPPPRAAEAAPVAAQRRPRVQAFLVGRRNLRRAIIAMTVLGPCRAEQPYGSSGRDRPGL